MLSAIILASLIKINLECESPWVATVVFVVSTLVLSLLFGATLTELLFVAVTNTGLSFLYFWLLKRNEQSSAWWPIAIVGVIVFVFL